LDGYGDEEGLGLDASGGVCDFAAMAPTPTLRSSGDLLADRRYAYAEAALKEGDHRAAADLAEQSLELAPAYAPALALLGRARAMLGEREAALAALARALELEPADALGVRIDLARLGALPPGEAMSQNYVRALFDDYAGTFDKHLVKNLNYRGPELLRAAVRRAFAAYGRRLWAERVLDLGCGTGLVARAFEGTYAAIEGVDLSPRMLAAARRTRLYDRLHEGDLLSFLEEQAERTADLVVSADVFVYLAALEGVFAEAHRVLRPGGVFAFTVQAHAGEGVVLGEDSRYAHGEAHLRALAAVTGFSIAVFEPVSTRRDRGADVPGFLLVLER
jgi:predicted TPR repeat methyltransferase